MKYIITKEYLEKSFKDGKSMRSMAKEVGCSFNNLKYWVNKYELDGLIMPNKIEYKDPTMFNKINTKEKAYIIGYLLADGYVCDNHIDMGCTIADREILDFIAGYVGGPTVTEDLTKDVAKRRFPRARLAIWNKDIVVDINKHMSSKDNKRVPIIPKHLERYMLQGFFDGDGCVTWGFRKDRDRLWHKIQLTSQDSVLTGFQNILLRNGIATAIHQRKHEDVSDMFMSSKDSVIKFLDFIYPNDKFIVLQRKYKKANALRLEFGEFGEPKNPEPSY